jgi:NAD-dependent histone deacetylase SIR2
VLYGEEHPQGESIGRMVERDLKGLGGKSEGREGKVDFLLVAGTSLSIPGVKRIIKEMAKSLHAKSSSQATGAVRTVFVNDQQPKGTEWNDVFDIWVKGDIQSFVQDFLENESYPSLDTPRKRTNFTSSGISTPAKSPSTSSPTKTKAKAQRTSVKSSALVTPPKKARRAKTPKKAQESKVKVEHGDTGLPTPRSTPPSPSRVRKGLSVTTFDQRLRFEGSLTPLSDDDEVPELAPKKERVVATGATPRDDDNPFLG